MEAQSNEMLVQGHTTLGVSSHDPADAPEPALFPSHCVLPRTEAGAQSEAELLVGEDEVQEGLLEEAGLEFGGRMSGLWSSRAEGGGLVRHGELWKQECGGRGRVGTGGEPRKRGLQEESERLGSWWPGTP